MTGPRPCRRAIAGRLLGVVLLLSGLDTAAWLYTCQRIEDGVRAAAGQAEAEGWSVRTGPPAWAGWPVAAEIRFPAVAVRGPRFAFPPGLAWNAERVRLRIGLRHPTALTIAAEGRQTIAAEGVPAIPFTSAHSQAAIDLTGRNPMRARLAGLEAALPGGTLRIEAAALQFPAEGVAADLAGIALRDGAGHELAPPVGSVGLQAHAAPPFPAAPTPADSARAWRAAGGAIEVSDGTLRWGPLAASFRLSIGLDQQLQPAADGTIEARGLAELLDLLVQAGTLPSPEAVAAKAVLAILSAPAGGGAVSLPLALHGGVLSVARFPLLRLPALVWE